MARKKGLGRGLDALFADAVPVASVSLLCLVTVFGARLTDDLLGKVPYFPQASYPLETQGALKVV